MSTKTLRKRIALVAVSALGFGVLGSASAFAAAGDITAVTATSSVSSDQLTISTTYTGATDTTLAMAQANLGLIVLASPDADLPVGLVITSTIAGLVTVTTTRTDATSGTETYVFDKKVGPNSGVYQFRYYGTLDANAGASNSIAKQVDVSYNPPILGATELQASNYVAAASHRVKSVALTTAQAGGQAGTEISMTPSFLAEAYTLAGGSGSNITANAEKATLRYVLTKPTGSTATLSASTEAILQTSTATASATADTAVAAAASSTGTAIRFTPDVAGAYSVTAYHDADGDLSLDSGEAQAIRSYTIGAAGSIAISLLQYGALTATGTSNDGTLIRVSLLSGTSAGSLAANETIGITVVGGGLVDEVNAADVSDAATYTLGRSDFNSSGRAWINVVSATDGVNSIVFTGSGGNMAGVGASTTAEFVTVDGQVATAPAKSVSTATGYKINSMALGNNAAGAGEIDTDYLKGGSVTLKATTAVKETYVDFRFVDQDRFLAGLNANAWNEVVKSDADKAFTVTIAHAASALLATDTTAGTMTFTGTDADGSGTQNVVVQFRAQASAAATTTVTPSVVRSALLGTNSFTATLKDQFGVAMNNAAIAISVAGRNATTVNKNDTTSSLGQVTYSVTDAGLSTNTTMTDTVTFDGPGGSSADGTASITYGTVSVGSVTVTSPNTSAGVATTVIATTPINAGSGGAEDGAVSVTAVIADSSGAVVAGIPVTWTVSGTSGAAITSTTKTSYTDSTGTATASVYGWTAGAYTITATAGGKSGTGAITFGSTTATNARIVSATVSGSIVTAKVVDRFGNPVSGVKLYATKTGVGYFGNGLSKTDGTTDSSGTVDFNVAGGDASVTVSAVDPSAAAGSTYGQTCAKVGFTSCAATATAIVAPVAGTSTVNEANVGNDIAPAGVASATVAVTVVNAAADSASAAADAAAEATDAANAATDAANAAAEAADAATAAAQDAADAVAALSTQVSEMVNALKKQITALTNLVIKIQKKVKA
jgi:trimeric autotransporter adhesin